MITRITRNILKQNSMRYFSATGDIKPLTTANRIPMEIYTEMFNALLGATTCEDIARRLTQAEGHLDDKMLAYAMMQIEDYNFRLDEGFERGVIPLMTRYIRTFDRENNQAFTDIVSSAGALGVADEDFWRAVKEVMVMQRMYRYIPLEQMGDIIKSFAIVGQADETMLELLGNQVIKHKRFLPESTKSEAKQGFQIAEIGFAEFKRALEEDEVHELDLKE